MKRHTERINSSIIMTVAFILLSVNTLFGQTEVKGRILDLNDKPVPGACILIKGTPEGTVTNIDGYFTITVPYGESTLFFSFIGYKQFEQPMELDKKSIYEMKVTLVEDKPKNKRVKSAAEVTSRPLQAVIQ